MKQDRIRINSGFKEAPIATPWGFPAIQYSEIYKNRLDSLRPSLVLEAQRKWPDVPIADDLLEVSVSLVDYLDEVSMSPEVAGRKREQLNAIKDRAYNLSIALQSGQPIVIIGTLFKPNAASSFLDEYSKLLNISIPSYPYPSPLHEGGDLILEDDRSSIGILTTDTFKAEEWTNGFVVALYGCLQEDKFEVFDYVLPGVSPLRSPVNACPLDSPVSDDVYVAFCSRLAVNSDSINHAAALTALKDWITGVVPNPMIPDPSKISHLFVAGNTLISPEETPEGLESLKKALNRYEAFEKLIYPCNDTDQYLADIGSSIPTVVLPGKSDPTNYSYPQQPIPTIVFPNAAAAGVEFAHNPCVYGIGGSLIMGTDGSNVADVTSQTNLTDIDALERILESRIIIPTAPETLDFYPSEKKEFLTIKTSPNIFFSGRSDSLSSKIVFTTVTGKFNAKETITETNETDPHLLGRCLLLNIPSFLKSKEIVLVNMKTLDVISVSFGSPETDSFIAKLEDDEIQFDEENDADTGFEAE